MPQPQMHPLTKWILGALLAILLLIAPAFGTLTYTTLAEDIDDNKKSIEKLSEAVQEIKTQGAVQQAIQSEQLKILQAIRDDIKNVGSRPGS